MNFPLIPDYKFPRADRITPQLLAGEGVRLLILDVDNTIAPYKTELLDDWVLNWASALRQAGVRLYIVSNNKGRRPEIFAKLLDVPYIKRAGKPSPRGVRQALEREGTPPEQAALVGDQIYTDTIAANLAGVKMLLVEPIKFTNIFLAIRYGLELPFRHARKKYMPSER